MAEPDLTPKLHGWIILDKPLGIGSTPCVSAVKRALREGGYAKVKVGHGGTLDPLATGVLPIALGEATKLAGRMLDSNKNYDFTIQFGAETDTLDAEGAVTEQSDHRPSLAELKAILPQFTGPIEQIPPKYSALKIDGKPAYARARAGEDVEMKMRAVTIHALCHSRAGGNPELQDTSSADPDPRLPGDDLMQQVTLTAHVSKGTYIRSLARDIARALNTVGHVTMLHRSKAGPFSLKSAISLDKLDELAKTRSLEQALLPLAAGLDDIPALSVTPDQARQLRKGQRTTGNSATAGLYLATDQSVPVALVECDGIELKVVRGFNL
ncbi:tRNA pseudouridine(55) synthase TruB [Parasphingopyxis sp. CP4]|uniref:tRNA pseudouridine(55) synthase TruB n=1 Tax=Parasphingopyxis sp. CP4 TaxID=2724527 RepID=UPI0015A0C6FA|nr:tRNA pseudouridine(55) synthase TruB [Parasphingopyxis sp. CP4]QLC22258.1 tRNA pseudouridine(55) synthase TruB [Parasphingopyxis sp. CP4]